jgi:hypothetical protein
MKQLSASFHYQICNTSHQNSNYAIQYDPMRWIFQEGNLNDDKPRKG